MMQHEDAAVIILYPMACGPHNLKIEHYRLSIIRFRCLLRVSRLCIWDNDSANVFGTSCNEASLNRLGAFENIAAAVVLTPAL